MSTSTREGEILTIKQVADYLKVTERTIYRLAAAKKIPAFKVGGSCRLSLAAIDGRNKAKPMGGRGRVHGAGGEGGVRVSAETRARVLRSARRCKRGDWQAGDGIRRLIRRR